MISMEQPTLYCDKEEYVVQKHDANKLVEKKKSFVFPHVTIQRWHMLYHPFLVIWVFPTPAWKLLDMHFPPP